MFVFRTGIQVRFLTEAKKPQMSVSHVLAWLNLDMLPWLQMSFCYYLFLSLHPVKADVPADFINQGSIVKAADRSAISTGTNLLVLSFRVKFTIYEISHNRY